jgi:hypothetical protein
MIAMVGLPLPPRTARGLYEVRREPNRVGGTAGLPTAVGFTDSMPSGTGSSLDKEGGEIHMAAKKKAAKKKPSKKGKK